MKTDKIKVGQVVWIKRIGYLRQGEDTSLKETTVISVGNKYVQTAAKGIGKFYIDTLKEDCGNYVSNHKLYLSKGDYDIEVEVADLAKVISSTNFKVLSVEKLRQIQAIIKS